MPQYSKVKSITSALFLDDKNLPSKVFTLTNVGGRRGKSMFYAQITMPVDVSVCTDKPTNVDICKGDTLVKSCYSI